MRNLANHMLMTTVAIVKVIHAGMKMSVLLKPVADTAVLRFEKRATPQVRAAKPNIVTVRMRRRREEDLPLVVCEES